MLEWISENAATLIISAVILFAAALVTIRMIKKKKSSGCNGCGGCPMKNSCGKKS